MDISQNLKVRKKRPPEKSVRFPVATHDKLLKIAKRLNRNQAELIVQMVEYFYRTSKDPLDINDDVLKNTLVKNHDTYIRFIRTQEEKVLLPIKVEVDRMIQSQFEIIECLNSQVLNTNEALLQNQQKQLSWSTDIERLMRVISESMETKEGVKAKCVQILNQYIKLRESFTFTTSAKEKEDLINATRQQLARL